MRIEKVETIEQTGEPESPVDENKETVFTLRPRIGPLYYLGLAVICSGVFAYSYFDPARQTGLIVFLLPLVVLYLLVMMFWSAVSRTEISLDQKLTKKSIVVSFVTSIERWNWSEIRDLRKTHFANPEKCRVVFKYKNSIRTLASKMRDAEATQLVDALSERLEEPRAA
ncbi:hypothetical protein [Roseibium sp. MMSF_3544]|uniref:hypothetical protein n=1 Tax=unclassified Roseibium TaxID=2629323 RepID=UPI00273EBD99|nr:hypothetical protein [Roseibium sp. MMSF_3544]